MTASKLTTNETLLKESLLDFFKKNKSRFQLFYDVVNKKTEYSLRVFEWFVTKYAEKYDIVIPLSKNGTKECNVALDYHNQMASYQKKCFDPFRRHSKFMITDGNGLTFMTTVCQMNFFKWAIENKVVDYVQSHLAEIKQDMAASHAKTNGTSGPLEKKSTALLSSSKSKKTAGNSSQVETNAPRKRRTRSSISSIGSARTCIRRFKSVVLEFD